MVTYPRTDSQYVTEDMKETVEMLAEGMTDFLPFLESGQTGGNMQIVWSIMQRYLTTMQYCRQKKQWKKAWEDFPVERKIC